MRCTQSRSISTKSPHFDTRIHVSTQINMTPKGIKCTSFIGRQQRATLADNESRPAQKHAGSHVCHHRIENLNHLGFPATLKHTTPELPRTQKRCPGEKWQRGWYTKRSTMRLQLAPSQQNNKKISHDFFFFFLQILHPPHLSPTNTIFTDIVRWHEDCTFSHAVTEKIVLSQVTLLWQKKVLQNSRY